MSPAKPKPRKDNQRTRQDRRQSDRLALKRQLKTKQHSSTSPERNHPKSTQKRKPYGTRPSQCHCPHCGRHCSESEFQPQEQELFARHCSLCSGRDEAEKSLGLLGTCLICCCKFLTRTIDVIYSHYATDHNVLLDSTHSIRDIRREWCPEEFPDLNFHHSFGSYLTRKNPILERVDPDVGTYWDLLNKSPSMLQFHIHDIGDRYREVFKRFFTAETMSLHGHISDASSPALLTSLICHLTSSVSENGVNPFVNEDCKGNPCVAVLEGSYGAGFGPLAHHSVLDDVKPLASGKPPVVISVKSATAIDKQVRKAKRAGCVALIAEIVRARDGLVISPTAWKHLLKACEKHNLILVVDEALTAIRCGAPFAYQLPQFQKYGLPDLVLFGKAIKTNGIAVDWRGVNMRKLNVTDPEDRMFTALQWQERFTEMAPPASLLASWGTIVLAGKENWPQRARGIGSLLRTIIVSEGVRASRISGLNSLIYLPVADQARISSPIMAASAGRFVRWFPTMDEVMMSEEQLRAKVFGPGSVAHRREVGAYLRGVGVRLRFCSRCGQAVQQGRVQECEVCVVGLCEDCDEGGHVCPMGGVGG